MIKKALLLTFLLSSTAFAQQVKLLVAPKEYNEVWNTYYVLDYSLINAQQNAQVGTECNCTKPHPLLRAPLPFVKGNKVYCHFKDGGLLLTRCVTTITQ